MTLMNKESWDAMTEEIERTVKNIKSAQKSERNKIIKRAQKYNGLIKTINDLFQHMDRLQKCSICRKDFYDKRCPDCIDEKNNTELKNLEQKRKYWELKFKKEERELKDLSGAYDIALSEINKLRKKLGYDKK